jgi:predicted phage tail protein
MLRDIIIEGAYAIEPFKMDADNIQQLCRGITSIFPDFKNTFNTTPWFVLVKNSKTGVEVPYNEMMISTNLSLAEFDTIIFTPEIEGSFFLAPILIAAAQAIATTAAAAASAIGAAAGAIGSAIGSAASAIGIGAGGAAAGTGLGATAFTIGGMSVTWGGLATTALMAASTAMSLTNTPKIGNNSVAQGGGEPISYLYNNPPNVTEAGNPIPLIYGRTRVGGTVLSSSVIIGSRRITQFKG